MIALSAGLICIPLIDQALKFLVCRWLGTGSVRLGPLGRLHLVHSQIWVARFSRRPDARLLWGIWMLSACGLIAATILAPVCGFFAGALLGGSFSHVMESSVRGGVRDFICLRFWPAFNLADVAITVGAIGLAWTGLQAVAGIMAWPGR